MREVPYDDWASYIAQIIIESFPNTNKPPQILEQACGTGTLLKMLQSQFSQIIALDYSPNMLRKANERYCQNLILGSMTKLPFANNSFDFIYCTHDSINYLQSEENLQKHFEETHRILKPNGLYLTDISTEANVIENFHGKKFKEKHNGWKVQWKNEYLPDERIIISDLEFEISKDRLSELGNEYLNSIYPKIKKRNKIIFQEQHRQKIFNENVFKQLVSQCKFSIQRVSADYNDDKVMCEAQLNVYLMKKK